MRATNARMTTQIATNRVACEIECFAEITVLDLCNDMLLMAWKLDIECHYLCLIKSRLRCLVMQR